MTEQKYPGIENLINISELDAKLARIAREKEKLEEAIKSKSSILEEIEGDLAEKSEAAQKKRNEYASEEKFLKVEQQKLVDRRKSLHTLSDYKSQMVAEREITAVSKQLSDREEKLIGLIDQAEVLEKEANKVREKYDTLKAEVDELIANSDDALKNIESRISETQSERDSIAKNVLDADLKIYERVAERYPGNSVVPIDNVTCGGCFLGLGQQIVVELMRGKSLCTCRGCGRIVYLPAKLEE